jgi:hypothetical protein
LVHHASKLAKSVTEAVVVEEEAVVTCTRRHCRGKTA